MKDLQNQSFTDEKKPKNKKFKGKKIIESNRPYLNGKSTTSNLNTAAEGFIQFKPTEDESRDLLTENDFSSSDINSSFNNPSLNNPKSFFQQKNSLDADSYIGVYINRFPNQPVPQASGHFILPQYSVVNNIEKASYYLSGSTSRFMLFLLPKDFNLNDTLYNEVTNSVRRGNGNLSVTARTIEHHIPKKYFLADVVVHDFGSNKKSYDFKALSTNNKAAAMRALNLESKGIGMLKTKIEEKLNDYAFNEQFAPKSAPK